MSSSLSDTESTETSSLSSSSVTSSVFETSDGATGTESVEIDSTTEDFSKMIGFPLINETL